MSSAILNFQDYQKYALLNTQELIQHSIEFNDSSSEASQQSSVDEEMTIDSLVSSCVSSDVTEGFVEKMVDQLVKKYQGFDYQDIYQREDDDYYSLLIIVSLICNKMKENGTKLQDLHKQTGLLLYCQYLEGFQSVTQQQQEIFRKIFRKIDLIQQQKKRITQQDVDKLFENYPEMKKHNKLIFQQERDILKEVKKIFSKDQKALDIDCRECVQKLFLIDQELVEQHNQIQSDVIKIKNDEDLKALQQKLKEQKNKYQPKQFDVSIDIDIIQQLKYYMSTTKLDVDCALTYFYTKIFHYYYKLIKRDDVNDILQQLSQLTDIKQLNSDYQHQQNLMIKEQITQIEQQNALRKKIEQDQQKQEQLQMEMEMLLLKKQEEEEKLQKLNLEKNKEDQEQNENNEKLNESKTQKEINIDVKENTNELKLQEIKNEQQQIDCNKQDQLILKQTNDCDKQDKLILKQENDKIIKLNNEIEISYSDVNDEILEKYEDVQKNYIKIVFDVKKQEILQLLTQLHGQDYLDKIKSLMSDNLYIQEDSFSAEYQTCDEALFQFQKESQGIEDQQKLAELFLQKFTI